MSIGSSVGSSRTVPTSIAATPSTSAWCIFGTSATRSSASPSTTWSSHSGRERSRRLENSRATKAASSASPPGAGRVAWRTCHAGSKLVSSTHTGLGQPAGQGLLDALAVARDEVHPRAQALDHGAVLDPGPGVEHQRGAHRHVHRAALGGQ